mmetsp:Transcript_34181/g.86451  ORF Transcript_34181/g.86451 Transcript_34181/m.86451 type:complete len:221 (+) Transcript_34181:787-1449(+)
MSAAPRLHSVDALLSSSPAFSHSASAWLSSSTALGASFLPLYMQPRPARQSISRRTLSCCLANAAPCVKCCSACSLSASLLCEWPSHLYVSPCMAALPRSPHISCARSSSLMAARYSALTNSMTAFSNSASSSSVLLAAFCSRYIASASWKFLGSWPPSDLSAPASPPAPAAGVACGVDVPDGSAGVAGASWLPPAPPLELDLQLFLCAGHAFFWQSWLQ